MTRSIAQLLEQDQIWRGQDGHVFYVSELPDEYLGNVLAYLGRHAAELLLLRRTWEEHDVFVERTTASVESTDPTAWLLDRPLYRRLLAEQRRRGAVDGDVVPNRPTLDKSMTRIKNGDALRELGES